MVGLGAFVAWAGKAEGALIECRESADGMAVRVEANSLGGRKYAPEIFSRDDKRRI